MRKSKSTARRAKPRPKTKKKATKKKTKVKSTTMKKSSHAKDSSWRGYNKGKMSKYMKSEGGHGPAMKRMSREYNAPMKKSRHAKKK